MSHDYMEQGRSDGYYTHEYERRPPVDDEYTRRDNYQDRGRVVRPTNDYGQPRAYEQQGLSHRHHHHERDYDAPHHHEAYRPTASSSHYDLHYESRSQQKKNDRQGQYEPYRDSRSMGYYEHLPPQAPSREPSSLSRRSRSRSHDRVSDYKRGSMRSLSPRARRSVSHERSTDSGVPSRERKPSRSSRSRSIDRSRTSRKAGSFRDVLYVMKYVDLEEYREEYRCFKYVHLTRDDRLRMFGTEHMPIFIPLARGETPQEYKERFAKWLEKQGYTYEQVHNDRDIWLERNLWIKFGNANVQSIERYEPPASAVKRMRSRDRDARSQSPSRRRLEKKEEEQTEKPKVPTSSKPSATISESGGTETSAVPSRQSSFKLASASAYTEDVVAAHLHCGCTSCLFGAMMKMAEKVAKLEDTSKARTPSKARSKEVVDLTNDESSSSPRRPSRSRLSIY